MTPHRILFHHIPKTAGTSVLQSVGNAIQPRTSKRGPFNKNPLTGNDLIASDPSSTFFSSHFSFDRGYFIPAKGQFLFTWIRHPVSMFYSACRYYRESGRPCQYFLPLIVAEGLRKLHRAPDIESYIDWVLENAPGDPTMIFPKYYFQDDWTRYDFIGVCEDHDRDIGRLGERLGLHLHPKRSNVTSQHKQLSEQDRKFKPGYRIEELMKYFHREIESYEEACERSQIL